MTRKVPYWKLPGGHDEPDLKENVIDCGLRELFEETGIRGEHKRAEEIFDEERDRHHFHIITVGITSLQGLKECGNDGEEVAVFSEEEVLRLDLLYSHREVVRSVLLERRAQRAMEVQRT